MTSSPTSRRLLHECRHHSRVSDEAYRYLQHLIPRLNTPLFSGSTTSLSPRYACVVPKAVYPDRRLKVASWSHVPEFE